MGRQTRTMTSGVGTTRTLTGASGRTLVPGLRCTWGAMVAVAVVLVHQRQHQPLPQALGGRAPENLADLVLARRVVRGRRIAALSQLHPVAVAVRKPRVGRRRRPGTMLVTVGARTIGMMTCDQFDSKSGLL